MSTAGNQLYGRFHRSHLLIEPLNQLDQTILGDGSFLCSNGTASMNACQVQGIVGMGVNQQQHPFIVGSEGLNQIRFRDLSRPSPFLWRTPDHVQLLQILTMELKQFIEILRRCLQN